MDSYELAMQAEDLVEINAQAHIYLEQFHAVPPVLAHLYLVHLVNTFICGDGLFDGIFAAKYGLIVPEAIRGFELLHMPSTAAVLSRAASRLGLPYPRGYVLRQKRLDLLLKQFPHEIAKTRIGWTEEEIEEDLEGFETMKAQLLFEDEDTEYFKCVQSENGGLEAAAQIYAKDYLQSQLAQIG
jgi:hypothetical protein